MYLAGDEQGDDAVSFGVEGDTLSLEEPVDAATPGAAQDGLVTAVQDAWTREWSAAVVRPGVDTRPG